MRTETARNFSDRKRLSVLDSAYWRLPLLMMAGGLLISGCSAPQSVVGSGKEFCSQGYKPQKVGWSEPAVTVQQIAQGRLFRSDVINAASDFIGKSFTSIGLSSDRDSDPTSILTRWAISCHNNTVIDYLSAGRQRYMVSLTYDATGRMVETMISPNSVLGSEPDYSIDLRNLPGYPEAYRSHPFNEPDSFMEKQGLGFMPPSMLQSVAEIIYNLPSNLDWNPAKACITQPFSGETDVQEAMVAIGYIPDGRYLRMLIREGAAAVLLLTDPAQGQPPVPGLC